MSFMSSVCHAAGRGCAEGAWAIVPQDRSERIACAAAGAVTALASVAIPAALCAAHLGGIW